MKTVTEELDHQPIKKYRVKGYRKMLERITIQFSTEERKALEVAAMADLRTIHEQARFLIRLGLELRGLLPHPPNQSTLQVEDESITKGSP